MIVAWGKIFPDLSEISHKIYFSFNLEEKRRILSGRLGWGRRGLK
jgi:hypothetical protein